MENCIFCKIAKGEVPATKVYEDADTVAFFDIQPKAVGHTLLIPKSFQDMPDAASDSLFRAAKTVAQKIKKEYGADFVRVGIVGTDIPHVHVHLFPQKYADKKPEV